MVNEHPNAETQHPEYPTNRELVALGWSVRRTRRMIFMLRGMKTRWFVLGLAVAALPLVPGPSLIPLWVNAVLAILCFTLAAFSYAALPLVEHNLSVLLGEDAAL